MAQAVKSDLRDKLLDAAGLSLDQLPMLQVIFDRVSSYCFVLVCFHNRVHVPDRIFVSHIWQRFNPFQVVAQPFRFLECSIDDDRAQPGRQRHAPVEGSDARLS